MTPRASSSSKGEKRTETQVATSVKKRLTAKSSKDKRTATFADEPVKRKLTRKTDTMNDDVLAPMESADSYPLNTVNTLLNTVTCALETNPRNDDSNQAKIQTILDDHKDVKKGRQKELHSASKDGCHDDCERSISSWQKSDAHAIGRSRERWLREIQIGPEGFQSCPRTHSAEMLASTPPTLSLKAKLAVSSHDRNNPSETGNIAVAIDAHSSLACRH